MRFRIFLKKKLAKTRIDSIIRLIFMEEFLSLSTKKLILKLLSPENSLITPIIVLLKDIAGKFPKCFQGK